MIDYPVQPFQMFKKERRGMGRNSGEGGEGSKWDLANAKEVGYEYPDADQHCTGSPSSKWKRLLV